MSKLAPSDYQQAADELVCDIATIKAVCEVEAAGSGYDNQERLKLRFEGHRFRKLSGGKYDALHPDISYPYSIQRSKQHGYDAFNAAFAVDAHLAMISTSWGMFQPMGEYFDECGYASVDEMVTAYRESEGNQLMGFVRQCKRRGIDDELRRHDWAGFAKNYNGASYRDNQYDTKLANAHARHSRS